MQLINRVHCFHMLTLRVWTVVFMCVNLLSFPIIYDNYYLFHLLLLLFVIFFPSMNMSYKGVTIVYLIQDIYNETASLGFHGFGHSSQMQQRAYAPVSSYLPPVGDPIGLPNARHFITMDSCYHQPSVPRNIPHVTSKAQFSHLECPVNIEQQVVGKRIGLRTNYLPQSGSFNGGRNFFGSSSNLFSSYQGSDGFAVGGFSSDWSKPFSGKSSLFHPSYAPASPKRVGSLEFSSNDPAMVSSFPITYFR